MTINVTSPVTGATMTGRLTSPTYTLTDDIAPDSNGRQKAVTALGGTQVGVTTHTGASPFTITAIRPKVIQSPATIDPVSGVLRAVGRNVYHIITRKGVLPLAGQNPVVCVVRTQIEVPCGAEVADPNSVAAALSAHIGALSQQSSGIGDTAVTAIL